MGILDRLKKTRDDEEEDEDLGGDEEESDDEDSGGGGLGGRFSKLRGLGSNAGGMLGKVLKRAADDDDEGDDNEGDDNGGDDNGGDDNGGDDNEGYDDDVVTSVVVAAAADVPLAEGVAAEPGAAPEVSSQEPVAEAEKASGGFEMGDLFSEKTEVDPVLRGLAESLDDIPARQLADELEAFLSQLQGMMPG